MAIELATRHIDVGIVVNDREAALAFWSGLLGFPVEGEASFPGLTVIRLRVGDAILRLCVPDGKVEREAATGPFVAETGLRYITLTITNLDAVIAQAGAAGYPVPFPPREIRAGHRAAQIQDGHGVTVELSEISQA